MFDRLFEKLSVNCPQFRSELVLWFVLFIFFLTGSWKARDSLSTWFDPDQSERSFRVLLKKRPLHKPLKPSQKAVRNGVVLKEHHAYMYSSLWKYYS